MLRFAAIALYFPLAITAQTPAPKPAPAPRLWVTTSAWPDGGEIPMTNAARGDNKSPAFEFHWNLGLNPCSAPESLQSYALIFHDVENSSNKTSADTLHWSVFNIPGTAKGLPEGMGPVISLTGPEMVRALHLVAERHQLTSAPARGLARFITMCSSFMLLTRSWTFPLARHVRIC
jgi:hypothetical protein